MALRVVFLGNSQSTFSNCHFQALIKTDCDLVGVVDAPANKRLSTYISPGREQTFIEVANELAVPVFAPLATNESRFLAALNDLNPDLFISIGYTNILKKDVLNIPKTMSVNFHASLLPAYRGKHPVFWALRNGERWSGLSVHEMDAGTDTGDIIYQVRVRTRWDDSVSTLYERIKTKSVPLVTRLMRDIADNKIKKRPQATNGISYYSTITPQDFQIDWNWQAEKIQRWIAITPGECFINIRGKKIYFSQAKVMKLHLKNQPGEILSVGYSRAVIATEDTGVSIKYARLDGEEEQSLAALINKLGLKVGDSLI